LVGLEFEDHQNKTDICILIMFWFHSLQPIGLIIFHLTV
jgi:hypothetical protein